MIGGLIRFVVLRVFGARVLLVLAVLGWLRNRVWPRKPANGDRPDSPTRARIRRAG